MRAGVVRSVFLAAAGAIWLAGCNAAGVRLADAPGAKSAGIPPAAADPQSAAVETTGTVAAPAPVIVEPAAIPVPVGAPVVVAAPPPPAAPPSLLPDNYTPSAPNDDVSLAKEHFRQGNYGMAENYFRRAVEAGPRDAEAWLGLAASYDRLRRFDLADRAYGQLVKLIGRTPTVLNNMGYSYMLRGDFSRARSILLSAQAMDPNNPFIANNLALLDEKTRTRSAVR